MTMYADESMDPGGTNPKNSSPFHPSFLQSRFWADFKAGQGWESLWIETPLACGGGLSVLVRRVRGFPLAYAPFPPLPEAAPEGSARALAGIAGAVSKALPRGALFIRFDLPQEFDSLESCGAWRGELLRAGRALGLRGADTTVQAPDTVVLDLTLSEEGLLAQMKGKWRYNIRLAEKRGVTVRQGDAGDLGVFYGLYGLTARRDGIGIHAPGYYESLFKTAERRGSGEGPDVRLYLASHGGEVLAGIITLFFHGQGVYLYGASSNSKRNLMAPYLLQWRALRDARAAGCTAYDLYGIPPTEDEGHPMHGLYLFKTGFGGRIIHRPGCVDVPLSPLYPAFVLAERARSFYYKRFRKIFRP
ncbi:MAG: peptidoglycan bridge formation glycyltransferase FemA/FemB family protein [Spirochaetaceae bacterium]|jgi:lipid II:glycine glycyltransferase (peptidoglycan interpeptide bridge formation enzyme)|nr:peptidoglycan bridge formation glycyltransferase FemA/FemB family protein [Spirochaetaceae bacterium]